MPRLILRPYQFKAVTDVIDHLDDCPILVAPTGSGKTVMAVEILQRLNRRTLWIAHRKELIDQAHRRLGAHGLNAGIIMAGYPYEPMWPVQVASVQTLVRRDLPPAKLIVIDECHHASSDSYRTILEGYQGVPVVGLTATPFRLDGRGLGDLFGRLVTAATTADLCEQGVLHKPRVWASKSPDLRGVRVTAGDYNLKGLAERVNNADANADIVQTWVERAFGKKTVCFAVDVEHSQDITNAFQEAGIAAEHLDGSTPREERDAILHRLATGETTIVSNCMVLTEGWDLPALECAIVARPTASLNLHLQMIGRIMRSADGKDGAIVLDHAGNHHVHGLVTRRLEYSLDSGGKVGFSEPLGLRRCGQCGLFFEMEYRQCPECGWQYVAPERDKPDVYGSGGELVEFAETFDYKQSFWNITEAQREAMGYAEGWSAYRFKERFGEWPILAGRELVDVNDATMEQKEQVYRQYLEFARSRGYKAGFAAYRYKEIFGVWPQGFVRKVRDRDGLRERFKAIK